MCRCYRWHRLQQRWQHNKFGVHRNHKLLLQLELQFQCNGSNRIYDSVAMKILLPCILLLSVFMNLFHWWRSKIKVEKTIWTDVPHLYQNSNLRASIDVFQMLDCCQFSWKVALFCFDFVDFWFLCCILAAYFNIILTHGNQPRL